MTFFKRSVLCGCLFAMVACGQNEGENFEYFGETHPGNTPQKFAPGIISKPDRWEGNAVFSTDGRTFFFNVFIDDQKSIYQSVYDGKSWSEPKPFDVIGAENNWEPFLSKDGQSFYFVSSRPPGTPEWNGRIWKSVKQDDAWLPPEMVDLGHDTDSGYWFPNLSDAGNLYFGGNFPAVGNAGKGDGYMFDSRTQTVVNIKAINTAHEEWDPFIAPDERFIMWASDRPG